MEKFAFVVVGFLVALYFLFKGLEILEGYIREWLAEASTYLATHPEVVLGSVIGALTLAALVMSFRTQKGAITARSCTCCGSDARSASSSFCVSCGASMSMASVILRAVPALASGLVAALVCLAAGMLVPDPGNVDVVTRVLSVVRASTIPVFDVACGFIAGFVALVALPGRDVRAALALAAGSAVLYCGGVAAALASSGTSADPGRIALAGVLALVGAMDAHLSSAALSSQSTRSAFAQRVPGMWRYPVVTAGALVAIVALLLVYALALGAILVALFVAGIALLLVGIYAIIAVLRGGALDDAPSSASTGSYRTPASGARTGFLGGGAYVEGSSGDAVGESREHTGILGDKYTETRDIHGHVIGESREHTGILGDKYTETRDIHGHVIGESREHTGILGDKYTETRDIHGNVIGESREHTGILGDKYTETRDVHGNVISESRGYEGVFGDKYTEHKRRS